jgi:nucleotide-binding universal stress UspA family protein
MKVLIPVDGSANSNASLDFILSRAACLGADPDLRLLNVQFPIPPRAARAAGRELVRSYHQTEAKAVLDPAQKCLAAAGLKAKAQYVVGSPGEVVSRTATQGHADLVVMGSRGQTALKGLLFGSVTQAVLAASTAPLLVLRDGPPPRAASLRVVIAVDGSRHGLAAVRAALALQAVFGPAPQFRLLHVLGGLIWPTSTRPPRRRSRCSPKPRSRLSWCGSKGATSAMRSWSTWQRTRPTCW